MIFSDNDAAKWSTSAGEKSSEAKNQPWFDAQNAIAQLQEIGLMNKPILAVGRCVLTRGCD